MMDLLNVFFYLHRCRHLPRGQVHQQRGGQLESQQCGRLRALLLNKGQLRILQLQRRPEILCRPELLLLRSGRLLRQEESGMEFRRGRTLQLIRRCRTLQLILKTRPAKAKEQTALKNVSNFYVFQMYKQNKWPGKKLLSTSVDF